jgi:translation initiation factor 3 subunit L
MYILHFEIVDVENPIGLELPNQWLWDIIDEFIYQYESFCRYRSRVDRLSEEERAFLAENADVSSIHLNSIKLIINPIYD